MENVEFMYHHGYDHGMPICGTGSQYHKELKVDFLIGDKVLGENIAWNRRKHTSGKLGRLQQLLVRIGYLYQINILTLL